MYNLQIALEQVSSTGGDVQLNTKRIIETIQKAQSNGAELIVFPELCVSGYGADDFFLKDQFLGSCQKALLEIASATGGKSFVLVGYPEQTSEAVYSSIAIMTNGKIIGNHRKTIIPNVELYAEHRYFKAGNKQTVIELKGIKIGIVVSEELFVDEAVPDCDLICCCAAFPWSRELSIEREQYLHYLAREKQAPIIYVNNVGITNSLLLEGCSSITNEDGKTLLLLRHFEEDAAVTSMNQLKDKEHPVYCKSNHYVKELYWAVKYVIKEFIEKTSQQKALVLMDGSLNSQLLLYIAMKSLGAKKVSGLYIQSRFDSPKLKEKIQEFADSLGVKVYNWKLENDLIHGFISQAEHLVDERWKNETHDRFKAAIFVSVAELLNAWPVSSVDKTQVALGIKDNISSFALTEFMPLTDVYHTRLVQLAEYVNISNRNDIFPNALLDYARDFMLKKSFINEGRAINISEVDEILTLYIEKNQSVKQILSSGFDEQLVISLIRRLHQEEWSRVRSGFSPKLSNRSFKNDWLFPSIVDWDQLDIKSL